MNCREGQKAPHGSLQVRRNAFSLRASGTVELSETRLSLLG